VAAPKRKNGPTSKTSPFSVRNLILVETVLLVGLGKEMLEWLVLERLPLPPVVRVLLGMLVVAGTLGGLLVLAERRLRSGLDKTHRKIQRRYRLPAALEHAVVLVWIFLAYAAFWDRETGALTAILASVRHHWATLTAAFYG
jgi:uncharacterized membrane protein